jgi:hypothetical protein
LLFRHLPNNTLASIFDNKGFSFTTETQDNYNRIKNEPHLYVAWTNNGNYYIGKSFQIGGRWKRQHAYHLGTLAYHLLDSVRYDDQNHAHWIEHWMDKNTKSIIGDNLYTVNLREEVYISFIPFRLYSKVDFNNLDNKEIRLININIEKQLIQSYREESIILLNIQHN